MGSRGAVGVYVWALFALVVGCGRSVGGEGAGKPIAKSDLPSRLANLLCDGLAGCCKSGGFPIDVARCKVAYTASMQLNVEQNEGPFLRYDAQAAADCVAQISTNLQCDDFDSDDTPACQRVFVGTLALGEPCNSARECAPVAGRSVRCQSDDGLSPEVCAINSGDLSWRGEAGDACGATCFEGESCDFVSDPAPGPGPGDVPARGPRAACYQDDGLYCDDSGSCAPLLGPGAPCSSSAACGSRTYCNIDAGLCSPPQPDGSSCHGDEECLSDNCDFVGGADPAAGLHQICVSRAVVSAERCERASTFDLPDSAEPAEPGMGAGTP